MPHLKKIFQKVLHDQAFLDKCTYSKADKLKNLLVCTGRQEKLVVVLLATVQTCQRKHIHLFSKLNLSRQNLSTCELVVHRHEQINIVNDAMSCEGKIVHE